MKSVQIIRTNGNSWTNPSLEVLRNIYDFYKTLCSHIYWCALRGGMEPRKCSCIILSTHEKTLFFDTSLQKDNTNINTFSKIILGGEKTDKIKTCNFTGRGIDTPESPVYKTNRVTLNLSPSPPSQYYPNYAFDITFYTSSDLELYLAPEETRTCIFLVCKIDLTTTLKFTSRSLKLKTYVVGPKRFQPDIQKPRQMENAVRDI